MKARLAEMANVTTKQGDTFRGLMVDDDGRVLVMRQVSLLSAGSDRAVIPVDGEIVLRWDNIAYVQVTI